VVKGMTIRQVVFLSRRKRSAALGILNQYLLILKRSSFESSVRAVSMISFSCRARTRLSVLTRLRACPNARGTGNLEKCIKVNWLTE
jgi:hypothetical protein